MSLRELNPENDPIYKINFNKRLPEKKIEKEFDKKNDKIFNGKNGFYGIIGSSKNRNNKNFTDIVKIIGIENKLRNQKN